jgi:3-phenylpropionate/trans-cinnamate dioxygenase ferredoxin reductase component
MTGDHGETFVIVGANLTGGAAATTLRDQGFEGSIVMIGAEPHPPYERPALSKDYLRGETAASRTLLHPEAWYGDHDIDLRLGTRATGVDLDARRVGLEDGQSVRYDKVLVATGGRNRKLAFPGADLQGVYQLRTIEEADAIRAEASPGRKAAILGAGFIGCEVAASLRVLGVDVEIVDRSSAPLLRVLGPEIAALYRDIHADHGVRFHFGDGVEALYGSGRRIQEVATTSGLRIGCDFVVAGVGIEPAAEVVEGTAIALDNGIPVDELCRAAAPDVYAAGDVANHRHPVFGRRLRVEHYDNALKMGAAAARNMLGRDAAFDDPHWFWSEQYDTRLEYEGFAIEWDQLIVRGSLERRDFLAFYVSNGIVVAAAGMNRGKEVRRTAALIKAHRPVDPAALGDQDLDVRKLASALVRGA